MCIRDSYFAVPLRVLLLAAAVGYAVSGVLLRGDALHGPLRREEMCIRDRVAGILAQQPAGRRHLRQFLHRFVIPAGKPAVELPKQEVLNDLYTDIYGKQEEYDNRCNLAHMNT